MFATVETFPAAFLATLSDLAERAALEVLEARVAFDDRGTVDYELWLVLPSGNLGAIGYRANQGAKLSSARFAFFGESDEQTEAHEVLAGLGLVE